MKEKITKRRNYGRLRISRDVLAKIYVGIGVPVRSHFQVENWEIENLDDLSSISVNKVKKIFSHKSYDMVHSVMVGIWPKEASVTLEDASNNDAFAEFHRICDLLDKCRTFPVGLVASIAALTNLIAAIFLPDTKIFSIFTLVLALILFPMNFYIILKSRYILFSDVNSQNFFVRKRDELLLATIAAIFGAAITLFTQYVSHHFWPSAP